MQKPRPPGTAALFLFFFVFGELVPVIPDILINVLGPAPILGLLVGGVLALVCLLRRAPLAEDARGRKTRDRAILLYLAVAAALLDHLSQRTFGCAKTAIGHVRPHHPLPRVTRPAIHLLRQ